MQQVTRYKPAPDSFATSRAYADWAVGHSSAETKLTVAIAFQVVVTIILFLLLLPVTFAFLVFSIFPGGIGFFFFLVEIGLAVLTLISAVLLAAGHFWAYQPLRQGNYAEAAKGASAVGVALYVLGGIGCLVIAGAPLIGLGWVYRSAAESATRANRAAERIRLPEGR